MHTTNYIATNYLRNQQKCLSDLLLQNKFIEKMKITKQFIYISLIIMLFSACKISYSFRGVSYSQELKTVSMQTFENVAPIVQPSLSQDITEALKTMISSQTKLELVNNEIGDVSFEGKITNYSTAPQAIQSEEAAASNRLTITIQVKFTNTKDSKADFDQAFTRYADYPSGESLDAVEQELNKQIIQELVEDVFNKAFVNW